MALPIDVTDPGTVGVESQAFGIGLPAQVVAVGVTVPVTTAPTNPVIAANFKPGLGVAANIDDPGMAEVEDQNVMGVGFAPTIAGGNLKPGSGVASNVDDPGMTEVEDQNPIGLGLSPIVAGGNFQPGAGVAVNVVKPGQVDVANQPVPGTGLPRNVFV